MKIPTACKQVDLIQVREKSIDTNGDMCGKTYWYTCEHVFANKACEFRGVSQLFSAKTSIKDI